MAPKKRSTSVVAETPSTPTVKKTPSKPSSSSTTSVVTTGPNVLQQMYDKFLSFSYTDKITLVWFFIDACTHLIMEASFLYFATQAGGAIHPDNKDKPLAKIWQLYAEADDRWGAYYDPAIVAVEYPTVFFAGIGSLFCLYGIWNHSSWRHLLVVLISMTEFIGNWYTFAPDVFEVWGGRRKETALKNCWNSDGSLNFKLFWIYIVFMNGLWVVVPLVLLWDSGKRIIQALEDNKTEQKISPSNPNLWHASLGYLVFYIFAVPLVLVLFG